MDIINWVPPDWRGALTASAFVLVVVALWPKRQRLVDLVLVRLGSPVQEIAEGEYIDKRLWRDADIKDSGLPIPIICIDRKYRVRVYNREAEKLAGHPWNAAYRADVGLLLTEHDAAVLRHELGGYLRDRHGGHALRMVGARRSLGVERPDGSVLAVMASITDFGNGHGGWQIALLESETVASGVALERFA